MKLFPLIKMQFNSFTGMVKEYLSKTLGNFGQTYNNSTIFGQFINVMSGIVENIFLYIEDAITEQNKYTAQRKKSIYGLAALSGYQPGLGTAAGCTVKLVFKPTNKNSTNMILSNKTPLICSQNGLIYNIILPQEAIILNIENDNALKYLYAVEGKFENQSFMSKGGQLYSQTILLNGDVDLEYLKVKINNEVWEKKDSLYDMDPNGKQYVCKTSIKKGITLLFGNNNFGKQLNYGDEIKVEYLIHHGELGNINLNNPANFVFKEYLRNTNEQEIDANDILNIELVGESGINGGTFSETTEQVKEMIGYNSRSLVLADSNNYRNFLNKFSFVGYSKTWCEPGSLIINSLILKNYKLQLETGQDYFKLTEPDFFLTDFQKKSIKKHIEMSGQQMAGITFNLLEPKLCKYACYLYVKMSKIAYDQILITEKIKEAMGRFFTNIQSNIFISKSDIIHLLKNQIPEVDSIDVYFISEKNEQALKDGYYINVIEEYDNQTGLYNKKTETVYLYDGENPGLGLDEHGNIYLDNNNQFPVLMGGWNFISSKPGEDITFTSINDPLTIVFE